MTKSREDTAKELFGIIGVHDKRSEKLRWWNAYFVGAKINASMEYYPTQEEGIAERLSEMFHFDRRGYIVGKPLQKAIIPLLDSCDSSVFAQEEEGSVDTIVNRGGVLVGFLCGDSDEKRRSIWFDETHEK